MQFQCFEIFTALFLSFRVKVSIALPYSSFFFKCLLFHKIGAEHAFKALQGFFFFAQLVQILQYIFRIHAVPNFLDSINKFYEQTEGCSSTKGMYEIISTDTQQSCKALQLCIALNKERQLYIFSWVLIYVSI